MECRLDRRSENRDGSLIEVLELTKWEEGPEESGETKAGPGRTRQVSCRRQRWDNYEGERMSEARTGSILGLRRVSSRAGANGTGGSGRRARNVCTEPYKDGIPTTRTIKEKGPLVHFTEGDGRKVGNELTVEESLRTGVRRKRQTLGRGQGEGS